MHDPHYTGFFDRFNRGEFFEAHEVLEELWLPVRGQPHADFYKGLIQLAGAFVHVQKLRPGPALALLQLAESNVLKYSSPFHGLDLDQVRNTVSAWRILLDGSPISNVRERLHDSPPVIQL